MRRILRKIAAGIFMIWGIRRRWLIRRGGCSGEREGMRVKRGYIQASYIVRGIPVTFLSVNLIIGSKKPDEIISEFYTSSRHGKVLWDGTMVKRLVQIKMNVSILFQSDSNKIIFIYHKLGLVKMVFN